MVETTQLPTTNAIVFRPDLPPLDAATCLVGSGIDCTKAALDALDKLSPGLLPTERVILDIIRSALDTAVEKQQSAIKRIQEHQRIPGNN